MIDNTLKEDNTNNDKVANAIEVILEEMKRKDKLISQLKNENEMLHKKIEELTNRTNSNTGINQKLTFHSPQLSCSLTPKSTMMTKIERKQFLKEVKEKVPSNIFRQFIYYVKLLTDETKNSSVDKNGIIEKIKLLFGIEYIDLFRKFQTFVTIR